MGKADPKSKVIESKIQNLKSKNTGARWAPFLFAVKAPNLNAEAAKDAEENLKSGFRSSFRTKTWHPG
jgi:hypothetical protein